MTFPLLRGLCVAVAVIGISGCTSWPKVASDTAQGAHAMVPDNWSGPATTIDGDVELSSWWSGFGDKTLSGLIDQALSANNDIAAARGRLRTARATLASARGARLPAVSASGNASRSEVVEGTGFDTENYSIGIDATWELDLFGRLRGAGRAAAADLEGSRAGLNDVQRIIASDVALNYINLRDAQARLSIARQNLAIQQDNLSIARWRYQAGMGNELDVVQAQTVLAQSRATVAPLEQTIANAIHQIDVLLGNPPGYSTGLLAAAPLPSPPDMIDAGIPADLLQRRPDVIAARRNLEAEILRIGVARAELYPALRLSGVLETSAASANELFDTSLAGLVGSITAPVFQGGQIRARIERQKGSADVALANYRSSLLRALLDVEDALHAADAARRREADLREAEQSALQSLTLAEIRYRSGAIDFQTLLDVQRNLLSVQDSRASATAARSTAAIQLFKALGGGWQVAGNP